MSSSDESEPELDVDNMTLAELAAAGELDGVDLEGLEEMASEELAALEAEDEADWEAQALGEEPSLTATDATEDTDEGHVLSVTSQDSVPSLTSDGPNRFAKRLQEDDSDSDSSDDPYAGMPVWQRPPSHKLWPLKQRKPNAEGGVPRLSPRPAKEPFEPLNDLSRGIRPSCERLRTATSKHAQPLLPDWHIARQLGVDGLTLAESVSEARLDELRDETSLALDCQSPPGSAGDEYDHLADGTMHVMFSNDPRADPLDIDRGRFFDRLGPNTVSVDANSMVIRGFSKKDPVHTRTYPGLVKPERSSADVAIMRALLRRPVDEAMVRGQDARDGTARKAIIEKLQRENPPPPRLRPSAGVSLSAPVPEFPRKPQRKARTRRLRRMVRRRQRLPGTKTAARLKATMHQLLEDGKTIGVARKLQGQLEAERSKRVRELARQESEKRKAEIRRGRQAPGRRAAAQNEGHLDDLLKAAAGSTGAPVDLDDDGERERLRAKAAGKVQKGPVPADAAEKHIPVVMNRTFRDDLLTVLSAHQCFDPLSGERKPDSLNAVLHTRLAELPAKQNLPTAHLRFPLNPPPQASPPSIPTPYAASAATTLLQPPALLFPAHWMEEERLRAAGLETFGRTHSARSVQSAGAAEEAAAGAPGGAAAGSKKKKKGKKKRKKSPRLSPSGSVGSVGPAGSPSGSVGPSGSVDELAMGATV